MKKCLIVFAVLVLMFSAFAQSKFVALTNTLNAVSARSTTMTTKELTAYVKETNEMMALLTAMYSRDVKSLSGRQKWHGKVEGQLIDTNRLIKVTTYADGTQFEDAFELKKPIDIVKAKSVRLSVMTNGIPAKLAAARLRRAQEKAQGTNEVTVVIDVNGVKKGE